MIALPMSPARRDASLRADPNRSAPGVPVAISSGEADRPALQTAGWIVIGIFAAVLAIFVLRLHPVGDYYAESDFYGGYADGARMIMSGALDPRRYTVVGPVYEIAVALMALATRDLYLAGKLVSALSALGTLALWWILIRRRAGSAAGLGLTLFLSANAVFLRLGYSASTDMLAMLAQTAAMFVTLEGRGAASPALAGAITALAVLTRYSSIHLVPAAVLCYAWLAPAPGIGRGRAVALYLAGLVAITAPWIAFSLAHGVVPGSVLVRSFGFYWTPDPSRNIQDLLRAPGESAPTYPSFGSLLRAKPGALVARMIANVPEHLGLDATRLLGVPCAIVCGAGALLARWSGAVKRMIPVWVFGAALFALLVPAFHSERYSLALAPFYLTLAGLAFGTGLASGRGRPTRFPILAAIALVAVALSIRASASLQREVRDQLPVEVVPAGRTLATAARPGDRVMSRKGQIGYYSGLRIEPFPRLASLLELGEFARAHRVAFLYYSWYESLLRPEFSYLLDTTANVPGLDPIFSSRANPAVLYRVGPDFGRDPAWIANEYARALHVARAMVRVLPESLAWRPKTVLAVDALAQGRDSLAIALASSAVRAHPADSLGWVVWGEAERALGHHDAAAVPYRRALDLDPTDVVAGVGLGWALLSSGRREQAAAAWRPFVSAARDSSTRVAMSRLFRSLGDLETAKRAEDGP
jgi:hypothetical protein